jgi:hypothetical protein
MILQPYYCRDGGLQIPLIYSHVYLEHHSRVSSAPVVTLESVPTSLTRDKNQSSAGNIENNIICALERMLEDQ